MNKLLRIGQVAEKYGISKRTLRYYEEIGLIKSTKIQDSPYRYYDLDSISTLEQVLLLRSLDFCISEIGEILLDSSNMLSGRILQKRYKAIQTELGRLTSISKILETIIKETQNKGSTGLKVDQLLKEQIYINKKIEGVLHMNQYDGDIFIVEFGINIVQYANDIINNIKELRIQLQAEYGKELPLIRIRDVEDLRPNQYRLVVKGLITIDEDLTPEKEINICSKIVSDLKSTFLYMHPSLK